MTQQTWPEGVIARYLTVGGATVEMRSLRFTTRYTPQGRPYVSDKSREVDGSSWFCLGCGADGSTDAAATYIRFDHGRYLPNERDDARRDANAHAEKCRAMPKPGGQS